MDVTMRLFHTAVAVGLLVALLALSPADPSQMSQQVLIAVGIRYNSTRCPLGGAGGLEAFPPTPNLS